jgi:hypothetical protein
MDLPKRGPASSVQMGSPVTALLAALLFGTLTVLVEPPWSYIERSSFGYLILTAAHFFPLFVLSLRSRQGGVGLWVSTLLASVGSVALCLHAGLSHTIVENIDAGMILSPKTLLAVLEIFLSSAAVPLGLITVLRFRAPGLAAYMLIPALFAGASQAIWFGLVRLAQGPGGIELWFASRIIIQLALGLAAGFLFAGARLHRPKPYPSHWGGFTELVISKMPNALPLTILIVSALMLSGVLRVGAELGDTTRLVTVRIDDYFLSLANLRRAEDADLVYPGLFEDLARSRNALLGAASFDPELVSRTRAMLKEIESDTGPEARANRFRDAVLSVNQRLLGAGAPFFLEPHTMGEPQRLVKFLFRYKIERRGRYGLEKGGSVPMLRLRRLDDILIDTPYTGLSYPGLGTVLMDHIDDTALRAYAPLFSDAALEPNPTEGRFAATARLMRQDRRDAILRALKIADGSMKKLAAFSKRWGQLADLTGIRAKMDVPTLSAYDALTEAIARQTEVHESRHAFDNSLPSSLTELEELSAGPLKGQAISEIRAYLTEIIDGPLGPKFGLSTLAKMIIGPDARANAYFFASVVILEGLWGEKVRRPDIVETEGEDGPHTVLMPITRNHPGWLSYSRIHGAYADLSALDSETLRARALEVFKQLFGEEYRKVKRRR